MVREQSKAPLPKVGDHVECRCAPACARSWPKEHGPCVLGVVVTYENPPEPGLVLVRMDHGGFWMRQDIGFGQHVRRWVSRDVWSTPDLKVIP